MIDREFVSLVETCEAMRAEIERLRAALEIIAGRRPALDNLMGNVDIAVAALDHQQPLPSVNWKDGKMYSYCPECGRREPPQDQHEAADEIERLRKAAEYAHRVLSGHLCDGSYNGYLALREAGQVLNEALNHQQKEGGK
jgi:hypothetical protein